MLENKSFQGKSILFISPSFFGYEVAIKNKLIELGATVTAIDDRPSNSSITKGLIRIHKDLAKGTITKYYEQIAEKTVNEKINVIFLLNPEALSISFLKACKSRWPNAYCVMYMWDSIKNRKHTLDFLPYCDRVFTFERDDAKLYGFKFKPLFYLDIYKSAREKVASIYYDYDLCFMGTVYSDRYAIAREVRDWCTTRSLRCFFYFYIQDHSLYLFNKLRSKGVMPSIEEVSFERMSFADVVKVVSSSKAVLDIQHSKQNGLTMRTLETLGAGRKLVTTNADVRKYNFYDERQITVIDRLEPTAALDLDFFRDERCYVPLEKIGAYSIESWLQEIILEVHGD